MKLGEHRLIVSKDELAEAIQVRDILGKRFRFDIGYVKVYKGDTIATFVRLGSYTNVEHADPYIAGLSHGVRGLTVCIDGDDFLPLVFSIHREDGEYDHDAWTLLQAHLEKPKLEDR